MRIGGLHSNADPVVATIGFFDGVHRGHRHLIAQVIDEARRRSMQSMIITFSKHPREVLQPGYRQPLLSSSQEKLSLLEETGIDHCLLLDFDSAMAAMSARQFMALLHSDCKVQVLLIGYNHRFGHNRIEGFEDYVAYARELGMEVLRATELPSAGPSAESISSSYIRRLLTEGDIAEANRCLGYTYALRGKVVGGFHVGRSMGFPTANLQLDCADKLIPCDGVYAVYAEMKGQRYKGMLNIGTRPTLDNGDQCSIEVNVFDFCGNLYGCELRLELVQRTRGEQKFASIEELSTQLKADAQQIKSLLS